MPRPYNVNKTAEIKWLKGIWLAFTKFRRNIARCSNNLPHTDTAQEIHEKNSTLPNPFRTLQYSVITNLKKTNANFHN